MPQLETKSSVIPYGSSSVLIQSELDEIVRSLKEDGLLLEQSRVELTKLGQRNASISTHLQQLQGKLGQVPADEIRLAYESALDAQQRLFVMRGQVEKLGSDTVHLERMKTILEKLQAMSNSPETSASGKESTSSNSVEMLVNAQESERQRLSRQMHDGPAQALSNFILQAEIVTRLMDIDPDQARVELVNLKKSAMSTFNKVRNFISDLRPMMLDDLGLIPTLRRYTDTFKEQNNTELVLTVTGTERRVEPYLEVLIFRAMQELLSNATRVSQATLTKVLVDMGENVIKFSVDDNGKGTDPGQGGEEAGLGLKWIKERVELIGGTYSLDSAPGKGTRVILSVPVRGGNPV